MKANHTNSPNPSLVQYVNRTKLFVGGKLFVQLQNHLVQYKLTVPKSPKYSSYHTVIGRWKTVTV